MKQGDKIRVLRTKKGISQDYMASQLNITQPAYANIESNKTKLSVNRLQEIATILQVKVDEIVNFDDKINIENVTNSQVGFGTYKEAPTNNQQLIISLENQIEYLKKQLFEKDELIGNLLKKI